MFPLKADDPYINKDGSRTTLGDVTGDIAGMEDDIDALDGKIDDAADSITPVSQTGTKATAAITAGTYFYLGGDLVKAKTNIAIDDTFTENTNYEKVTAGGLNDLIGMVDALDARLDTAEGNITTLTGSIKLKRGSVPGNSENSFDVNGSTIIFAIWSNSAMTITVANEGSSATVLGTLPSGAEINSVVGRFTLKNPNSYSCIIYYMSNF